jgi:hypothetical protein
VDQATLVREQFDGGAKLLARLRDHGFAVTGAFWAKTEYDGQWYLYIVAPTISGKDPRPAFGEVRETLRQMAAEWTHAFEQVEPSDVKLLGTDEQLAKGLLDWYAHHPQDRPALYQGSSLGSVSIEGAYIYPAKMFVSQQP